MTVSVGSSMSWLCQLYTVLSMFCHRDVRTLSTQCHGNVNMIWQKSNVNMIWQKSSSVKMMLWFCELDVMVRSIDMVMLYIVLST